MLGKVCWRKMKCYWCESCFFTKWVDILSCCTAVYHEGIASAYVTCLSVFSNLNGWKIFMTFRSYYQLLFWCLLSLDHLLTVICWFSHNVGSLCLKSAAQLTWSWSEAVWGCTLGALHVVRRTGQIRDVVLDQMGLVSVCPTKGICPVLGRTENMLSNIL